MYLAVFQAKLKSWTLAIHGTSRHPYEPTTTTTTTTPSPVTPPSKQQRVRSPVSSHSQRAAASTGERSYPARVAMLGPCKKPPLHSMGSAAAAAAVPSKKIPSFTSGRSGIDSSQVGQHALSRPCS